MIKRKLLAVLLSFGLVFSNVLFVNASETQRLVDTKVETKKDAYTDLTKEEAEAKKEELEASDGDEHDFKITVTIRSYLKGTKEYDVIKQSLEFSSRKEAEAYIKEVEAKGYVLSNKTIKEVTHSEEYTLAEVYTSEEEARKGLQSFIDEKGLTEKEVTSKIEKVYNPNLSTVSKTEGTLMYGTEEEAQRVADALYFEDDVRKVYGKVRGFAKSTVIPTVIKSDKFSTRKEAEDYIESLKKQGYNTSDLKITTLSFEESVWGDGVEVNPGSPDSRTFKYGHFDVTILNKFTKVDKNGNTSTVNGTMTVNYVSINGKRVSMDGISYDYNTGKYEYTSTERHSLNVTNKSLVKITGTVTANGETLPYEIEGYLSEKQNVCGGQGSMKGFDLEFESVKIIEGKVVIDTNLVIKYEVTGTAYKTESTTEYYVDEYEEIKGYNYNLTASAVKEVSDGVFTLDITGEKEIMEERYALDVTKETYIYEDIKGNLNIKYITVSGETLLEEENYTEIVGTDYKTSAKEIKDYELVDVKGNETGKYIDGTIEVVYIYDFVGGIGGPDIDPDFPVTGVESNDIAGYTLFTSILMLLAIIIKKRF